MYTSGQHLIQDHERKLRHAEAIERLGLEEQAARGWTIAQGWSS